MTCLRQAGSDKHRNNGKFTGQKRSLKLKGIRTIRRHLQIARQHRDLTLANLAIDNRLRPLINEKEDE